MAVQGTGRRRYNTALPHFFEIKKEYHSSVQRYKCSSLGGGGYAHFASSLMQARSFLKSGLL